MASIVDLPDLIREEDHMAFLEVYLTLLCDGFTLSVPTEKNLKDIKEGWTHILTRLYREFTDTFLDNVSREWSRLIRKQGGEINPHFAEDLLTLLTGEKISMEAETEVKPKAKPLAKSSKALNDLISQRRTPITDDVTSSISTSYYKTEDAKASETPGKKTLLKKAYHAIKQDDELSFLVYYLSLAKQDDMLKVPLSSVLSIIKTKWEEILIYEHHQAPSDTFLSQLSAKWFYYMNQKGIPSTTEALLEILHYVMAEKPSLIETPPSPKKPGLFSKLFKK